MIAESLFGLSLSDSVSRLIVSSPELEFESAVKTTWMRLNVSSLFSRHSCAIQSGKSRNISFRLISVQINLPRAVTESYFQTLQEAKREGWVLPFSEEPASLDMTFYLTASEKELQASAILVQFVRSG